MSERRTYTLDDRAVGFLSAIPKDLNSKFVSDLIISFFDGVDLLSYPDWYFLSSVVDRDDVDGVLLQKSDIVSSSPIDQEKARLALVLSKLKSLDISSYDSFCQFLALPEVRVGGFFDWSLGSLHQKSGRFVQVFFGQGWQYYEGWDFVGLVPSSVFQLRSSDTVEFYLKEQVSLISPGLDVVGFLKGLFEVVSSGILRDLVYREKYGMAYSEYVEKLEQEEAEKKKEEERKRIEEKEKREEEKRREALEIERGKSVFIASVESDLREKLLKSSCGASSLFSKCDGELAVGYFLESPGWYHGVNYPFGYPEYTPVFCRKHLLRFGILKEGVGVFSYAGREYVIVSKE